MWRALKEHWPEYLIEAGALGVFMVSACLFTILLQHPASPVRQAIQSELLRRLLTGMAMGLTLISIVYSPWGKRSGAHMNPALTLTFFRLGKLAGWDAIYYSVAQFVGGICGILVTLVLLDTLVSHPSVNYAATLPGPQGKWVALAAEGIISFLLMSVILRISNTRRIARFTGLCAGTLVALYITLESPLSGMSMNPARSFGSAAPAALWSMLWIYFIAPPLGMAAAAEIYVRQKGLRRVLCAKLHHDNDQRCIFRCNYMQQAAPEVTR